MEWVTISIAEKKWMSFLRQGKFKEIKNPWTRMLFDYESATKNPRVLLSCELTDNHSHYKIAITFPFCWSCLSLSLLNSSQLLFIPSPFTKAACTFSSSSKVRCNRAVNMGPSPGWNFSCLLPSKRVNKMRALRRLYHGPWGKKILYQAPIHAQWGRNEVMPQTPRLFLWNL